MDYLHDPRLVRILHRRLSRSHGRLVSGRSARGLHHVRARCHPASLPLSHICREKDRLIASLPGGSMKLHYFFALLALFGFNLHSCSTDKPSAAPPKASTLTLTGSEWVLTDLAGTP